MNNKVIYPVTIGDLQDKAIKQIGRKLTDDEMYTAKKCVESGLSSVINITLKAAIKEAAAQSGPQKRSKLQTNKILERKCYACGEKEDPDGRCKCTNQDAW